MKHIHWLVPYKISNPEDIFKMNLASARLRSGLFFSPAFKKFSVNLNESISNLKSIDILLVGKFPENRQDLYKTWINYINKFRNLDKKIFFDYTDNHLGYDTLAGKFYNQAINENDSIITSSNKQKTNLLPKYKNTTVIEDPIEIEIQKIKKNKSNRFLFFGHPSNLKYLFKHIPNWDLSKNYDLVIQTSDNGLNLIQEQSKFIQKPPNLNIYLQHWSIANMIKEAASASGIIIPGDINDSRKNGVSHNRLLTAFALGLPVAATRYESYLEFDNQFANIDNQVDFTKFLINPNLFGSRVMMAQQKVKNYTKDNLAKKWLELLK
ncbi:MAG: hypothetical protein HOG84_02870 [Nitrosomonadales bacterium]|jgi:hypothetical protein|nr:hypothetical protein [Nitrosomonadales bacterium]